MFGFIFVINHNISINRLEKSLEISWLFVIMYSSRLNFIIRLEVFEI